MTPREITLLIATPLLVATLAAATRHTLPGRRIVAFLLPATAMGALFVYFPRQPPLAPDLRLPIMALLFVFPFLTVPLLLSLRSRVLHVLRLHDGVMAIAVLACVEWLVALFIFIALGLSLEVLRV